MVGLVFSAQAVGLIVGPLVALALLGGGAGPALTWRLLLGLGAIPAAAAVWLRRKMPEPPRYQAQAASPAQTGARRRPRPPAGLRAFLASRRLLVLLAGTAGCWFLLDYAYYGNTISTPQIIALITPHASQTTTIAIQLAIFAVAAVPGYALAIARMDRIGHRRLQLVGFIMMGACFAVIGLVPGMTTAVVAVPAGLRDQLLLHRVRPERHDLRPARRAVPHPVPRHRPRHLGRHREAGRVHRRVPVPRPAALPRAARHAAAHRRDIGPRRAAHPRPARARRPQPGGDIRRGRGHRRRRARDPRRRRARLAR